MRESLHLRVVAAFGLFGALLATVFGLLIYMAANGAEDAVIAKFLTWELNDYADRVAADPAAQLPSGHGMLSTFDPSDLPPEARADADRLGDGIHESTWILAEDEDREYHLGIRTLADGRRLLVYLGGPDFEALDAWRNAMLTGILLAIAAVTAFGVMLGLVTARRVIAPVTRLARRVEVYDPKDGSAPRLAEGLAEDEVGVLGRALDASMADARAYLDRERRFTRDASHELRSPLTVVRGAVELLESQPEAGSTRIRRPLVRIRRAADDMGRLIEAFLWLAREEALADAGTDRPLASEVATALDRHRHLLEGKPVRLRVEIDPDATVRAPKGVLGIVVGNLVANACRYTAEGEITVSGDGDALTVADTGPGISDDDLRTVTEPHARGNPAGDPDPGHGPGPAQGNGQGHGLGLAIVHDLCGRFGWRLDLHSRVGEGTRARVAFAP